MMATGNIMCQRIMAAPSIWVWTQVSVHLQIEPGRCWESLCYNQEEGRMQRQPFSKRVQVCIENGDGSWTCETSCGCQLLTSIGQCHKVTVVTRGKQHAAVQTYGSDLWSFLLLEQWWELFVFSHFKFPTSRTKVSYLLSMDLGHTTDMQLHMWGTPCRYSYHTVVWWNWQLPTLHPILVSRHEPNQGTVLQGTTVLAM